MYIDGRFGWRWVNGKWVNIGMVYSALGREVGE